MYWMIDDDFFEQSIAARCEEPIGPRENAGERRLLTLLQLLCRSVNGHAWRDPDDMARRLRRPLKQCERVWELCLEEGVLRPIEGGYSAVEWMKERGYFSDAWKEKKEPNAQSKANEQNDKSLWS